jgi:hypothetical protein
MREAAQPGRELKFAAIAPQQTGREGAQIERECKASAREDEQEVAKREA